MELGFARSLKITHLRLINAIAELGQLGLAAEAMGMTQPAASRLLAEIERTAGARLCDRHARGMELTLVGRALAQRSRSILLELSYLTREVDELKTGFGGTASVGAVTGAALRFVIPAVQQLKVLSPKAEIHVNVEPSPVLIRDLIDGRNDFVLARLPPDTDASDFDIRPANTESLQLVVRADHPLADVGNVAVADLESYPWVIQTHRSPIRNAVESAFHVAGAKLPENITNTTSLLVMIAILATSTAIAPMASEVSSLLLGRQVGARLKVLQLQEPIVMSPYYLLQMRGHQLSPVASRLKSLVARELTATAQHLSLSDI
jgi:DNA-binding transcriptional LysR family regulator